MTTSSFVSGPESLNKNTKDLYFPFLVFGDSVSLYSSSPGLEKEKLNKFDKCRETGPPSSESTKLRVWQILISRLSPENFWYHVFDLHLKSFHPSHIPLITRFTMCYQPSIIASCSWINTISYPIRLQLTYLMHCHCRPSLHILLNIC